MRQPVWRRVDGKLSADPALFGGGSDAARSVPDAADKLFGLLAGHQYFINRLLVRKLKPETSPANRCSPAFGGGASKEN